MNGISNANIRWVCLSDMHLGEEGSLLTARVPGTTTSKPACPGEVMEKLVACLEDLLPDSLSPRPTLVLAGDTLGLAMAPDNEAYMVLRCFVERAMNRPTPLFGPVVYIPGNHDHHVWETTRETDYAEEVLPSMGASASDSLPPVRHVTPAFVDAGNVRAKTSKMLHELFREAGAPGIDITVAYPNYAIVARGVPGRAVVFTHGHYMDDSYTAMSTLYRYVFLGSEFPKTFEKLEQENFAWIDFFWSAIGRSGEVGGEIQKVWDAMQDEKLEAKLADSIAAGFVKAYGPDWIPDELRYIPDHLAQLVCKKIILGFLQLAHPLRSQTTVHVPGSGTVAGLKKFADGPLAVQIGDERSEGIPRDLTLVFGHTHQPFAGEMTFGAHYPDVVKVFNTGGWVLDGPQPKPEQGAAILLLDDELNAALLRMYNDVKDGVACAVVIEPALPDPAFNGAPGAAPLAPNPLSEALETAINVKAGSWATFSKTVTTESQQRRLVAVGR